MTDKERTWDRLLQIKTVGRDDLLSDEHRYPYEPTPYSVLERLESSGLFCEDDVVLDYGCGKGRVGFFLSYRTGAKSVGIEYDAAMYNAALENQKNAVPRAKADFILVRAEEYEVSRQVNRCYFFNPFSVQLLRKVMARIIKSYYDSSREILLFFYYPSDEYMCYLTAIDEIEFYGEIDCNDLFKDADPRERIMIFRLPYYDVEE